MSAVVRENSLDAMLFLLVTRKRGCNFWRRFWRYIFLLAMVDLITIGRGFRNELCISLQLWYFMRIFFYGDNVWMRECRCIINVHKYYLCCFICSNVEAIEYIFVLRTITIVTIQIVRFKMFYLVELLFK